ncbi:MAG TPA: PRC-barrel domain-containing protein [Thermoanaerobaculia bacterium]|jgi:sporulation protein YlmC with PRC-barrel domain
MNPTSERRTLSSSSLVGDGVRNPAGENLGEIKDLMIDLPTGRVAYTVLDFGGVLGFGNKLFAVPWSAFRLDEQKHEFILDVPKDVLKGAPGFDKDNWPDMTDREWGRRVHEYYGQKVYWE